MPHPVPFTLPEVLQHGLYDPASEHDSCGVALVATLKGEPTHDIVAQALMSLRQLEHRGAVGSEADTGDGAGIITQMPDAFLRAVFPFELPPVGSYVCGMAYLPVDETAANQVRNQIAGLADAEGLRVLGWREVPTTAGLIGPTAQHYQPRMEHLVLAGMQAETGVVLERMAFCLRRQAERDLQVYFASLSCRTLVYKGMLTSNQLEPFYPDLSDYRFASKLAIVHSRFSTNTFPSWPLAQPFRMLSHNGEINTVRGNRNWMRAREGNLASDLIPGDLERLFPICSPGVSDSASFDEVVELLHLGGRSLPHAMLMMIPEAWQGNPQMDPARRAFYEYHSTLIEPWDGPACMTFTDGTLAGAVLDRNGLRPGRFWQLADGLVVLASEVGVLEFDPATVIRKGRLQPGRMFLVDTEQQRIIEDDEIKAELAAAQPYQEWLDAGRVFLADLPPREHINHTRSSVLRRQLTFGYTEEELRVLIAPMARTGMEPLGSMGSDTPLAVLSERPRLLFDYFTQLFAQVTNPPLDAIREKLVTSVATSIGPEANLLGATAEHCRHVIIDFPVLTNDELATVVRLPGEVPTAVIKGLYRVDDGGVGLARQLEQICEQVSEAIAAGARYVVLSDRDSSNDLAPIPSLLLTAAVHHHLLRERTRTRASLVIEAGDVREVHHVALLLGYGASAVNPYLVMESAEELVHSGYVTEVPAEQAVANVVHALGYGVLKTMSKMGISTIQSYRGAQIFEAIGLGPEVIDTYFTGTPSRLGGVDLTTLADEVAIRHARAYPDTGVSQQPASLPTGGEYQWRRDGEPHLFNPDTVARLQHATRTQNYELFGRYTHAVDDQAQRLMTLRGLFRLRTDQCEPIDVHEVESVEEIVRRFSTGAMSYGSISGEAHENLAIAMNAIGAKSNTGEGGEDTERLLDPTRRSAIKQVASGRFGVTSAYLTHATDIQIKMAQGAKPGEGGQLPGHKVYPWVARTRHSTPGVGLISPPPHHDIYSIEDLAQLIYDLKNANPSARVHVKLVAEVGVGTVAAGVSKAHADVVLISGHDGGTGASPLSSLKHAGVPWELGLAETQQTLLANNLRDRIVVQTDGQLKTGRDVIIAALLGAEEFGFATAPLVVSGCVMMRVCHNDTCPVGVATQNPVLRERFTGRPEDVQTFFRFIAQQVREYLAELGFRRLDDLIGRVELLDTSAAIDHWKASGLDLSPMLASPGVSTELPRRCTSSQEHGLDKALDHQLIALCQDALASGHPVEVQVAIRNTHRSVGTMLGHEVTKRWVSGLPDNTISVTVTGSAGQSFGAFVPRGITLRLLGDANDYVGKGLCGGRIVLTPDPTAPFVAHENVIAGNVVGYGATGGAMFVRGIAGERFCVRNSGATAVVEGVGDHALEYMTGGTVVILGSTGRNLAAGMSGGRAYVLDLHRELVNPELVDVNEVFQSDAELLTLVREHAELTGSTVAVELLADWSAHLHRWSVVVPRDYARVLGIRQRATDQGLDLDSDEVWAQIMEGSHG